MNGRGPAAEAKRDARIAEVDAGLTRLGPHLVPGATVTATLFLRHRSGATHKMGARGLAKLKQELAAGRGGPEVTSLVANGYTGFLGPDGEDWDLSALTADVIK